MLALGADKVPGRNQAAMLYPAPRMRELASVKGLGVFQGLDETPFGSSS